MVRELPPLVITPRRSARERLAAAAFWLAQAVLVVATTLWLAGVL